MLRALQTFIWQCAFASREDFVFEQSGVRRHLLALPSQGPLGLGRGWRGVGDQLFFLLSIERKQSGKWSVRTVSRRARPSARPASGSLAPSLGAASSAGPAAGPVSALHWIYHRGKKKTGSEGGEGLQGRSPTRSQHAQLVRLDFGAPPGVWQGDSGSFRTGLRGPRPELPSGLGCPLYQHFVYTCLCAPRSPDRGSPAGSEVRVMF